MPWHDWQFWIVTLIAGWGVWLMARPFLPRRRARRAEPGCPTCAPGAPPRRRKTPLTIGGKRL
jgi:hypothetical protein